MGQLISRLLSFGPGQTQNSATCCLSRVCLHSQIQAWSTPSFLVGTPFDNPFCALFILNFRNCGADTPSFLTKGGSTLRFSCPVLSRRRQVGPHMPEGLKQISLCSTRGERNPKAQTHKRKVVSSKLLSGHSPPTCTKAAFTMVLFLAQAAPSMASSPALVGL